LAFRALIRAVLSLTRRSLRPIAGGELRNASDQRAS
jgi:hypothetical protein